MGRSAKSASPTIRATETAVPDRASANAHPTGPPPAMATSTSGSSATADQGFHIPDRFRCGCGQHFATRGRNDDVVLDAYARVPELPRYVVGWPDIAARLYGQGHARLEAAPFPARFVFSRVMDVEAEPMSGAVHVEALVILGLDDLLDRPAAQSQVDESLSERPHRGTVRLVPAVARLYRRDRRGLRGEHQLVDVLLRAAEFSAHGESPRYIRGISVQLTACVYEQEIPVREPRVVVAIMQNAGVGSSGDDRPVRGILGAAAAKLVEKLRLDLVFAASTAGRAHRAFVGGCRDRRRAAHHGELPVVLEEAHLVERGAHVAYFRRRSDARARLRPDLIQPSHDARVPTRVGSGGVVKRGLIGEELRHVLVERLHRIGFIETEGGSCALGAVADAFPEFALRIALAAEENRPGLLSREEDQHRLGLGKPAQVVEIAVEPVKVIAVAIADAFRCGRNDRGALAHAQLQRVAALGAARKIAGGVHCRDCRPLCSEDQATRSFNAESRAGVPTSCQIPRCTSPETSPRAIAARKREAICPFEPGLMPEKSSGR